jgi:hypothetical protein
MTAEWFDLGQRLYAATTGRLTARLAGAPIPATDHPVAIRARETGPVVTVTAAVPGRAEATASGPAALTLLGNLGVLVSGSAWRTLVTDDHRTLPALLALARSAGPDGDTADTAAHLAWWADRADFPGSAAVVPLLAACRARWVTGSAPDDEHRAATWRAWLHVPRDDCAAMLAMLDLLHDGQPLALLDKIREDDQRCWVAAQREHADQRDWRHPDSTARAAAGLRSRCDTADLYAAALLTDPQHRLRAVHTGHVVTGQARYTAGVRAKAATPGTPAVRGKQGSVTVTCDRMDCRLRPGADVTGWVGSPGDTGRSVFHGTVTAAAVSAGALHLTVTGPATNHPVTGDHVTLHPAAPSPRVLVEGRARYDRLYSTRTSWLTTGRTPGPERRDVPLDVMVAAAGG